MGTRLLKKTRMQREGITTIPKSVRDILELEEGDYVSWLKDTENKRVFIEKSE